MKKTLSVLLMTVAFAVPAFADMHGKGGKDMKGHKECACHEQKFEKCGMHRRGDMVGMLIKHADKIGLTEDQVVKLKAIHSGIVKRKIRTEADTKLAKIELREIMEVKDFDLEKANAAAQKIADLKKDQRLEMFKSIKDVRNILTDEQFKKVKEFRHHIWEEKRQEGKKPEAKKHKEHRQE